MRKVTPLLLLPLPLPLPLPHPNPAYPLSPHPLLSFPLFSPPPPLSLLSSPALLPLPGLSVELRQQVWQRPRLSRKTRGLKAHKFHAVQHANVPSADKRAFNPAALLLSTLLPLSLLTLYVTLPPSLILSFSFSLFSLLFVFLCLLLGSLWLIDWLIDWLLDWYFIVRTSLKFVLQNYLLRQYSLISHLSLPILFYSISISIFCFICS